MDTITAECMEILGFDNEADFNQYLADLEEAYPEGWDDEEE